MVIQFSYSMKSCSEDRAIKLRYMRVEILSLNDDKVNRDNIMKKRENINEIYIQECMNDVASGGEENVTSMLH